MKMPPSTRNLTGSTVEDDVKETDFSIESLYQVRENTLLEQKGYTALKPRGWLSIVYILEGESVLTTGDGDVPLRAGDVLLVFPGEQERSRAVGPVCRYVFVDLYVSSGFDREDFPRLFRAPDAAEVFEKLAFWFQSRQPGYQLRCREFLWHLLWEAQQTKAEKAGDSDRYSRVMAAVLCIERRFDEPLSNEYLAGLCHMSRNRFIRLFAGVTGRTPMEYLRRTRMNFARAELERGHDCIGELAERCGYADVYSFSRSFRRVCGVPPTGWAKGKQGGEKTPSSLSD